MAEYSFGSRLKHAWNAFKNRDPTYPKDIGYGGSYIYPNRRYTNLGSEKTIISSLYNKIANDAAQTVIQHVRLDDNGRYFETINSGLNYCLNVEANIDQTAIDFKRDLFLSILYDGCAVIAPTKTKDNNPLISESFEIKEMRVGKVVQWYPEHVRIDIYDSDHGKRTELVYPKRAVSIIQNPFYEIMNQPNSSVRRLIHKMNLLDAIDEQSGAGKLDLLIQLPYLVKSESRKQQAEDRRRRIADQLENSKYGIAYIDATEKVTQLNRPIENNLMNQIEYLTNMVYNQIGVSQAVFDGTASDDVMSNYYSRTIEPLVGAVSFEINRKFLTKTARSQRQSIYYFKDPFKFVPVGKIAEIADKFTRNAILSSNEVRQIIGMKAVDDPKANELSNKNITAKNEEVAMENGSNQNGGEEIEPEV